MNLQKNWDLQIDHNILKTLQRIPRNDVQKILEVIKLLPIDPYFGDIQKMKGTEHVWRRRVGVYRIFYNLKITEKIIIVFHCERRKSKTY